MKASPFIVFSAVALAILTVSCSAPASPDSTTSKGNQTTWKAKTVDMTAWTLEANNVLAQVSYSSWDGIHNLGTVALPAGNGFENRYAGQLAAMSATVPGNSRIAVKIVVDGVQVAEDDNFTDYNNKHAVSVTYYVP